MGRKPYEQGVRFERKCQKAMEAEGWVCWRSPGSKTAADLIALRDGWVPRLIQCKLAAKAFTSREVTSLWYLAEKAGALPICASRGQKRGTIEWRSLRMTKDGRSLEMAHTGGPQEVTRGQAVQDGQEEPVEPQLHGADGEPQPDGAGD